MAGGLEWTVLELDLTAVEMQHNFLVVILAHNPLIILLLLSLHRVVPLTFIEFSNPLPVK